MITKLRLTLAAWIVMLPSAFGLSIELNSEPYVIASKGGPYFIKMMPHQWGEKDGERVITAEPYGIAYRITEEGAFKEMWKIEGRKKGAGSAGQGFLLDGRHFVQLGSPYGRDQERYTDPAITFYEHGKMFKEYRVRDLIRKQEYIGSTPSFYYWHKGSPAVSRESFKLTLLDGTTYHFDYKTGAIKEQIIDSNNAGDEQNSSISRTKDALEIFSDSEFKNALESHFVASDFDHLNDVHLWGYPDVDVWVATLMPTEEISPSAPKLGIRMFVPLGESEQPMVDHSAAELVAALRIVADHPYLDTLREDRIERITLHIRGDRLHRNWIELMSVHDDVTGEKTSKEHLTPWIEAVVETKQDPRFRTVYVNSQTGAVITLDEPVDPFDPFIRWKPVLRGSDGKRINETKSE